MEQLQATSPRHIPVGAPKMHPFATAPVISNKAISIVDAVNTEEVKPQSTFASDFLSELRDFMNEFAETDLAIDTIDEPTAMSKSQANFYIKLYNQLLLEEAEMNDLCDAEIERVRKSITLFREKRQIEIDRKKEYFTSILKEYAMTELDGKKAKTIKLPYGNLSFKKQQPKYDYGDETELKAIVKEINPELIKTEIVEKLDKTSLKKNGIVKDGQFYLGDTVIPGVTVKPQDDKFEIK